MKGRNRYQIEGLSANSFEDISVLHLCFSQISGAPKVSIFVVYYSAHVGKLNFIFQVSFAHVISRFYHMFAYIIVKLYSARWTVCLSNQVVSQFTTKSISISDTEDLARTNLIQNVSKLLARYRILPIVNLSFRDVIKNSCLKINHCPSRRSVFCLFSENKI